MRTSALDASTQALSAELLASATCCCSCSMRSGRLDDGVDCAETVPMTKKTMSRAETIMNERMNNSLDRKTETSYPALASPWRKPWHRDLTKNHSRYSSMAILLALRAAKGSRPFFTKPTKRRAK